jgi:hypothetical protein
MNVEYKGVEAEIKAITDDGEGTLRLIRFHQEDKESDVTLPGFIQRQESILLPAHNWRSDYPPLGKGVSFEDDGATNFKFRLNMDDPLAQRWRSWLLMDLKSGRPLQGLSYGYSVYPDGMEYGQKDGRRIRFLKPRADGSPGAKLHEVSFVTVPAGNDTTVLNMKSVSLLPTRRFWPGGITPMKGVKDHMSEAVTSTRSSQRHFQTARRLLGEIPMTAKTQRLGEFLDAGLDELDTGIVSIETGKDILQEAPLPLVEVPPVTPPKAVEPTPPASDETADDPPTEVSEVGEKGGMPIHDELESVMRSIEQVTDRLEQVKSKRAEVSPRYPNGRPVSAERLEQVARLQTRLSRLKASTEVNEQQEAEQQELHEMAERLKRFGVPV